MDISDITATIKVAEVHPNFRHRGIGRIMLGAITEYLTSKNIYGIDLECEPLSSSAIWSRLGFTEAPRSPYRDGKEMFILLKSPLQPVTAPDHTEAIELWDAEPHACTSVPAGWIFSPEFTNGTRSLSKPIVLFGSHE
jgi:hypothetical protein